VSEFWDTEKGLSVRLKDIAHDLAWRTYNGALKMSYEEAGFKTLEWITTFTKGTCKYCERQHGRKYKVGQFLPRIPHHPDCKCIWDFYPGE